MNERILVLYHVSLCQELTDFAVAGGEDWAAWGGSCTFSCEPGGASSGPRNKEEGGSGQWQPVLQTEQVCNAVDLSCEVFYRTAWTTLYLSAVFLQGQSLFQSEHAGKELWQQTWPERIDSSSSAARIWLCVHAVQELHPGLTAEPVIGHQISCWNLLLCNTALDQQQQPSWQHSTPHNNLSCKQPKGSPNSRSEAYHGLWSTSKDINGKIAVCRFNALREENEGFSKMIVCLHSFGAAAAASQDNIPQIVRPCCVLCRCCSWQQHKCLLRRSCVCNLAKHLGM